MSRLTRGGTAEPVSRDQIIHFLCSADHEQDWQPYPVDAYSAICDDHIYIHTYYQVSTGVSYCLDYVEDIYNNDGPLCPCFNLQPKPFAFTITTSCLIHYSSCCHKSNT